MKSSSMKIWIIAALTGILTYLGFAFYKKPDNGDKEKLILQAVLELMTKYHFQEVPLDDKFSNRLFDTYMDRLDGMKRFLTIGDLDLLDDYQDSLDESLENLDMRFFDLSYDRINKAIEKTRTWYPEILGQPFNFSIKDSIETDGEKRHWAKDDAELKEFWYDYLKYETLTRLAEKIKNQEESKEQPEGGVKTVAELEQEARDDVKEVFDDWFDRLDKVRRSDRFEMYLNSVTNVFDPHSDYFNQKRKKISISICQAGWKVSVHACKWMVISRK
jgi:carboxyl-terminal processing protease